jgi:hypothetical protein
MVNNRLYELSKIRSIFLSSFKVLQESVQSSVDDLCIFTSFYQIKQILDQARRRGNDFLEFFG